MRDPSDKSTDERLSDELRAAVRATQEKIDHAFANGHKFAAKLKQAAAG
jgi:hypothetical protein